MSEETALRIAAAIERLADAQERTVLTLVAFLPEDEQQEQAPVFQTQEGTFQHSIARDIIQGMDGVTK